MRTRLLTLLAALAACLVTAGPASAGPGMYVGAAEDAAKVTDLVDAKAKMDLAALAGFNAIRMTAIWEPGMRSLQGDQLVAPVNPAPPTIVVSPPLALR